MFNDGSQNIEQLPNGNGEQKDLDEVQQERAAQWAESFPNEPNPWAQEPDEKPVDPENQDTPVATSADTPNQIRNTSNQVTAALEGSWNEGEGGPSLQDSYDSLRGNISTTDVQQLVDKAEPTISHIQQENSNNASFSENASLEEQFGDNNAIARTQVKGDLHDLSVSAGTVAFGAQAKAEQTIDQLEQNNDDSSLQSAEQELLEAQQQIETLTQETEAAAKAVEDDQKLVHTAETMTSQAQELVAQAQENLQQAADEAEQRKDEIAEHQEEVDQLIDSGAIDEEQLNKDLTDGQSIDQIIQDNAPIANALGGSPNIQTDFDPLTSNQQQPNPELVTPQEEEPEGPLLSIFG